MFDNIFTISAELENRLLSRFDAASQKRELTTMAECAKILSQVRKFCLHNAIPFLSPIIPVSVSHITTAIIQITWIVSLVKSNQEKL